MDNIDYIKTGIDFFNDERFIIPVLAYANHFCKSFSLEEKDRENILLCLEEALKYSIDNFFDEENSKIRLQIFLEETQIKLIIKDKGLPMDPAALPEYSSNPENENSFEGIGIFIIKKLMDEVQFKNLGKHGKEWHLIKKFSHKRIDLHIHKDDKMRINPSSKDEIEDFEYTVRPFEATDALSLCKLAYFTYGYSYSDYIYYPQKVIKMVENKELISHVAVNKKGEVIGHVALEFSENSETTAELGVAFTNPNYRGHKVFHNLCVSIINEAKAIGLKGLYANAVTGHTISQIGLAKFDFIPTGINLGYIMDFDFKKITGISNQRLNTLTMFLNFTNSENKRIYLPPKYAEITEYIYELLNMKRHIKSNIEVDTFEQEKGIMHTSMNSLINVAFMEVHEYGKDTLEEIISKWKYYKLEKVSVIYLYLDLENEYTPFITKRINEMGFIFAGIIPNFINEKDALIMQFPNNMKVDFSKIQVYNRESEKLLDFIKNEYEQIIL